MRSPDDRRRGSDEQEYCSLIASTRLGLKSRRTGNSCSHRCDSSSAESVHVWRVRQKSRISERPSRSRTEAWKRSVTVTMHATGRVRDEERDDGRLARHHSSAAHPCQLLADSISSRRVMTAVADSLSDQSLHADQQNIW